MRVALIGLCLALGCALGCAPLYAQEIQMGSAAAPHKGHVELLSDAVEVKAGEPQVVDLRFRVQDGFHIN